MSFPKMDNSIKSAIKDLKEIVSRQKNDDQEVVSLVTDIESIISDIEIKASKLTKNSKVVANASETNMVVPSNQINSSIPAI